MIELLNKMWVPMLFVIGLGNIVFSVITRMNHISHLDKRIDEMEHRMNEKFDTLFKETANQGERIAKIEGRLNGGLK